MENQHIKNSSWSLSSSPISASSSTIDNHIVAELFASKNSLHDLFLNKRWKFCWKHYRHKNKTYMVGNILSCCGEWREGFVLRRVKQNDTQGQRAPVCKLWMTGVSVWFSSFQTNRKSLQNVSTSSFFHCW